MKVHQRGANRVNGRIKMSVRCYKCGMLHLLKAMNKEVANEVADDLEQGNEAYHIPIPDISSKSEKDLKPMFSDSEDDE